MGMEQGEQVEEMKELRKNVVDHFWRARADSRRISRSFLHHGGVLLCYKVKGWSAVPSCCDPACRFLGKRTTMSHQEATFSGFEVIES